MKAILDKLKAACTWVAGLFGNPLKAIIGIFIFLAIMIFFAVRCSAATPAVRLQAGVSFGCLSGGPVLGLELEQPLAEGLAWDFGTTLWGRAHGVRNNFDWHAMLMFSRGPFGAAIGPAYLQNTDEVNGSHLNYALMLFWRPGSRLGPAAIHRSNGGTSWNNCGRNAGVADIRLR